MPGRFSERVPGGFFNGIHEAVLVKSQGRFSKKKSLEKFLKEFENQSLKIFKEIPAILFKEYFEEISEEFLNLWFSKEIARSTCKGIHGRFAKRIPGNISKRFDEGIPEKIHGMFSRGISGG